MNKYLEIDRYPITRVVDLLSLFQGVTIFYTLDLCQTYQQLKSIKRAKNSPQFQRIKDFLCLIHYHMESHLHHGILQREMEKVLNGILGKQMLFL